MNWKVAAKGASHLVTKRFLGPFWYRRMWLNRTQWFNTSELEALQLKLLRKLVHHCYSTVPYYRQLMDKRGITPGGINNIEDIEQFPVLCKKDVLAAGETIVSSKYPKWMMTIGLTGGTTGTPLSLPRSLFSVGNEHAFVRRQWDWAGMGFRDRTAYLSGRIILDADQEKGSLYKYDPFMGELILSTYHLSLESARQYAEAMSRYQVKAIVGYTSSIAFLAQSCLDLGIKVRLKAALTTSETINDYMRATISEAFGCDVYDFYGAAERVCYIFTCEEGSYHILPEYGLTELHPMEGAFKGQYKVVATGFWNWGMPLIRYDTGDVLTKSNATCSCGRAFPVVKSLSGRTGDVIHTPSGREFGPTLLARIAKGAHNIIASQIIQDKIDHIIVSYIPGADFTERDLTDFKEHMTHHFPGELKMDFRSVSILEKTSSGKINFLISKI